jgi:2,5-diketo-D-gluconate reductase A
MEIAMSTVPTISLSDGRAIPQLGLGVWQVDPAITARVVSDAITAGYRAIDTAQGYGNEEGVGEAIRTAGVARDELFITSKLRNSAHGRDKALRAFDDSMRKLGIEQVDLFLIHWPVPRQDKYLEAWQTLVELKQAGRIRSIGVSNFNPDHLERIIAETGEVPVVNQIEVHPHFQQDEMRAFNAAKGIAIESYSPLGSGAALSDKTIADIAQRHRKSVAQVIIRWHIQNGLIVIPKTTHAERLKENFDVFDFSLDDSDMQQIAGLDQGTSGRTGGDPATSNTLF